MNGESARETHESTSRTCKACGKLKPITAFKFITYHRVAYRIRKCRECRRIYDTETKRRRRASAPDRPKWLPATVPTQAWRARPEYYRLRQRLERLVVKLKKQEEETARIRVEVRETKCRIREERLK